MMGEKILYEIGCDYAEGKDVCVEDRYMKPSAEYPDGSWLHIVDGKVMVATGYYATIHPDKPSPHFSNGPPFLMFESSAWPWEKKEEK